MKTKNAKNSTKTSKKTYWTLYVDGNRVSDYFTFRRAWNAAKRINPDTESYELHPFDK